MNKYEQLIEFIINEQEDKARELFHQLVVEKSRDIYENLIDEEDFEEAVGGNQTNGLINDVQADESGMQEDELEMDGGDSDIDDLGTEPEMGSELGGDDMGGDDMGGEMGGEDTGVEGKIQDLEVALDSLKAEFDKLMGNDGEEELDGGDDMGGEEDAMAFGGEEEEADESMVREYVEKVAQPSKTEGGTVGTGGDAPTVNKQSIVAGKNDMGGTSANIAKGGAEQAADGKPTPKPSNQYTKGQGNLPGAGSYQNVPGARTKGYTNKATSYEKQHGKEGQTTDGKVSVDDKSVVGGKVR